LVNENGLFIIQLSIIKIDAYELQNRTLTPKKSLSYSNASGLCIRLFVSMGFCLRFYVHVLALCTYSKDVIFHSAILWFEKNN